MPTLILSPTYNTESKILRKAADELGWKTFRFQGENLPAEYEPGSDPHAIYCTVPKAFDVASRLATLLLGGGGEWLVNLPEEFSKRRVQLLTLKEARGVEGRCFIKPALGKSFDATVRTGPSLASETDHLPPGLLAHVAEPVEWEAEYRCFVRDGEVLTLSPYRRGGVSFSGYASPLKGPASEQNSASEFARSVLQAVPCPVSFVLDVGLIKGRGWAVVEPNECWGAGIYGCTPPEVLEVLLSANVPRGRATKKEMAWDYAEHYFRACPHMEDRRNW